MGGSGAERDAGGDGRDANTADRDASAGPADSRIPSDTRAFPPDGPAEPDPAGIFVAPTGKDTNPGTRTQPIQTLSHARDLVRTRNQAMTANINVYLEDGTHRLAAPLVLTPADSGTGGYDVIYRAAPGAHPIISGGTRVTGWKIVDAAKNLWSAKAPAGLVNTRQLYVDGVRAQRTQGRLPVTLTQTATGYTASAATMQNWKNPADIELVYTGGSPLWSEATSAAGDWSETRCPLTSITGTTLTVAEPCWSNSTKRATFPMTQFNGRSVNLVGPYTVGPTPSRMENAFELLGTPGQWYFDRAAGTIYYVPRVGEDLTKADVQVPVLEKLITGDGTDGNPIHNIVFSGLQFSYATWLRPSTPEGFSEIQANYTLTGPEGYSKQALCDVTPDIQGTCPYGSWTKIPANVSFSYASSLLFVDDAFVHLGGAGLDLGNGTQSSLVIGCVFTDISGNGIELGGVDLVTPTPGQLTTNNQIVNNHLYGLPIEYHGGVAIITGYAANTLIAHNEIDHTSYTAISMGWGGWFDKINKPAQPNPSHHNTVSDNLIHDHMMLLSDGAGIYTQGLTGTSFADGERLEGNVIYDQFGSGHEVYSDNGSTWMTIVNNVIFDANFDAWGSAHKNWSLDGTTNDPIDIEGNYWKQGDPATPPVGIISRGNHLISMLSQVPAAIMDNAGLQAPYQALRTRKYGAKAAPEPPSRVAAYAGDGFAFVSWNRPIFEGDSSPTSYTISSGKGNDATLSAADFASVGFAKISGLTNGTPYIFTVKAANTAGTSAPSIPSLPVTPNATAIKVPDAPTSIVATAGDGMVSVRFKAPLVDGGSPILSFTITSTPGDRTVTVAGRKILTLGTVHSTFEMVDGLENGTAYTFSVIANNAAGASAAAVSTPVTPSSM